VALAGKHAAANLRAPRRTGASEAIDWSRVVVFFGDERMVPRPRRPNYRMVNDALLSAFRFRRERPPDARRIANPWPPREHEERLVAAFPAGRGAPAGAGTPETPPAFDLILLGLGPDAHHRVLFLESPRSSSGGWVVENGPPPHRQRITLTFPVLNAARNVLFLATGKEKADAVRRLLKGERDPWRFPAQGVTPDPGTLTFLLDKGAAASL
jgi:6-phosphogluconolactonase